MPMPPVSRPRLAAALELLYARRNQRAYVDPDPLQCVYRYSESVDREIAGLVAAGLAYGRVAQIMRSINAVFDTLGPSPRAWIEGTEPDDIRHSFAGFRHRWTTGPELAELLIGVQRLLLEHGTLETAFARNQATEDESSIPALIGFCNELRGQTPNSLLPDPAKNAACKRLHLYLRWMVRQDEVDPGCWRSVSPRQLVVPVDTHMHQIARHLGLTRRKPADARTALEITRAFRHMCPTDPVKYDFVLTRFGIRSELSLAQLDVELRDAPA